MLSKMQKEYMASPDVTCREANVSRRHYDHSISCPYNYRRCSCQDKTEKLSNCKNYPFYSSLQDLALNSIYSNMADITQNYQHAKSSPQLDDSRGNGYTMMYSGKSYFPERAPVLPARRSGQRAKEAVQKLHEHASLCTILDEWKVVRPTKQQLDIMIELLKDIKEKECLKYGLKRTRSQGWIKELDEESIRSPRDIHRVKFWDEIQENTASFRPRLQTRSCDRKYDRTKAKVLQRASTSTEASSCSWHETLDNLYKFIKDMETEKARNIQKVFQELSVPQQVPKPRARRASYSAQMPEEAPSVFPRNKYGAPIATPCNCSGSRSGPQQRPHEQLQTSRWN